MVIDRLAPEGDPEKIKFPRSFLDKTAFDFSFSGLKTAVNRYIQTHPESRMNEIPDIAAGFQEAVVDVLSCKLINAAVSRGCAHLAIVGGVAANEGLRKRVRREAGKKRIQVHLPSKALCGDNAAMIAAAGFRHLQADESSPLNADVYSRMLV